MFQEKQGMPEFCPGKEEGEMMDWMKGWMGMGEKGTQAPGDAGVWAPCKTGVRCCKEQHRDPPS